MIAAPPLELGAVKLMVAWPLPAVAVPMVGAPGTVTVVAVGVTETLADALPVPALLVALTEQL